MVEGAPAEAEPLGTESPTIFQGATAVGRARLLNTPRLMLMNGLIGGLYVTFSGLGFAFALSALHGMPPEAALLVAGLFYPVGFIFVLLGKSELFTENFLTPVLAVWTDPVPARRLFLLWGITLGANLLGIFLAALAWSSPALGLLPDGPRAVFVELATEELARPPLVLFAKGVVGGLLISFMTWLVIASREHIVKLLMIVIPTYLIVVLHAAHSMVGSFEMIVGILSGAPGNLATWAGRFLLPVALGNMAGGVLFVSGLHYAQAKVERKTRRRREARRARMDAVAKAHEQEETGLREP